MSCPLAFSSFCFRPPLAAFFTGAFFDLLWLYAMAARAKIFQSPRVDLVIFEKIDRASLVDLRGLH